MLNDFLSLMRTELILTGIIFILLILRIAGRGEGKNILPWIQLMLLANFIGGFFMCGSGELFGGMFRTDDLASFQKNILNGGVYLISVLFAGWFSQTRHLCEFFILLLSALLGMFLMLSAGNLLMFYLSLELATIPVAALANFDLMKRRSSEAAMKMIFSSAFSSGIMLFGISLIYGLTGTLSFDELSGLMQQGIIYNLAFIFFLATFAFKLSVVPFHFWTADVYEGAPVPVTSFLSVISKGAVAFVFMNMLYRVFLPMQDTWYHVLVILAMLTMITGNLFALRQQNLKRFLAFSSVAQVGFILAGVSGGPSTGVSSVIFFIIVYIFSNLAAFAVVDAVAAQTGKESIEDYKGFYKTNPFLSWIMAIALFSLAGIPPTAGFFGKFFLLSSAAGSGNYWFLTFAAFNMVISLYYYLRVVRSVFIDQSEQPLPKINLSPSVKAAMIICAGAALVLGFMSWLFDHILQLTY